VRLMAPIMVHVSEEVWQALPGARERHESVHLAGFPDAHARWRNEELGDNWRRLREVRDKVNAAIEVLKPKQKNDPNFVLKSSLEAEVTLNAGSNWNTLLERYRDQLPMLLMVPVVHLERGPETGLEVEVKKAPGPRCERCWLVLPDVGSVPAQPELCGRCAEAVTA
jgi:isoleucyl-tRNA synthetase